MAGQPVLLDRNKPDAGTLPSVLASDDQPQILEALTLLLQPAGFHVDTVGSPESALHALRNRSYDALLMDLNYTRDTTSGHEGLELLRQVLEIDSQLPVIVMTAWASVDLAVEAMRRGARDFIAKPWENARLLTVLQTQVTLYRALRRAQLLEAENQLLRATDRPEMIAGSCRQDTSPWLRRYLHALPHRPLSIGWHLPRAPCLWSAPTPMAMSA